VGGFGVRASPYAENKCKYEKETEHS
jgi:hypothetical protein